MSLSPIPVPDNSFLTTKRLVLSYEKTKLILPIFRQRDVVGQSFYS